MKDESNIPTPEQAIPSGLPVWITAEAVRETVETFRLIYGPKFSVEDAIGILIRIGNLFGVLKSGSQPEVRHRAITEEAA